MSLLLLSLLLLLLSTSTASDQLSNLSIIQIVKQPVRCRNNDVTLFHDAVLFCCRVRAIAGHWTCLQLQRAPSASSFLFYNSNKHYPHGVPGVFSYCVALSLSPSWNGKFHP